MGFYQCPSGSRDRPDRGAVKIAGMVDDHRSDESPTTIAADSAKEQPLSHRRATRRFDIGHWLTCLCMTLAIVVKSATSLNESSRIVSDSTSPFSESCVFFPRIATLFQILFSPLGRTVSVGVRPQNLVQAL